MTPLEDVTKKRAESSAEAAAAAERVRLAKEPGLSLTGIATLVDGQTPDPGSPGAGG